MPSRRVHYLDWLRLSAVLAVVVFHALLPFGSLLPWIIQNDEQIGALALATALLPFAFPVFFLIAGASACFAVQRRSIRGFLAERTARLLLPFVVGTVSIAPLIAYMIAIRNGTWPGTLAAYLGAYPGMILDQSIRDVGFSPHVFQVVGMHLWFLPWLFLFSLLAAPIFAYLAGTRGRSLVDRLARQARWRGATLLGALPLTLVALPLFGVSSRAGWDWAVFGLWGGTFVGGFVLFSDERLLAAVRRDLVPALVAAGVGVGGLAATGFTDSIFRGGAHTYDATYAVVVGLHALSVWGVTLSVLSAAMRVRGLQRPLSARAADAALPTFVLHYPVVIAVSALVVGWPLGIWTKVVLSVGLSLSATFLVVAAATRISVVRPLLGLGSRRSNAPVRAPALGA